MRILRYSPDQPRDDHGRFGEGGGLDVGRQADYSKETLSNALADVMAQAEAMEDANKDEGKTYEALTHMGSALSSNLNSPAPAHNRLAIAFNSEGKIVGAGSLSVNRDKTEATITHVGSLQPGAGRLVVEKLLEQAREYPKVTTVKLTSSQYANAMSFYDKFGFKDTGSVPGALGEKDMELKLRSQVRSIEDYITELIERASKLADTPGGQPTVIYFMRHGQTDSDKNNLFGGQTLEEMNAEGVADLRAGIADVISKLDFGPVFSDGLPRTHQAAEMVLPYSKSASEVTVSALATAWGCGDLSGQPKTPENVARKRFYVKNPTVVPPSTPESVGESIQHSEHRWLSFLAYVISLTPPGSASLCTCHSSGIKVISKTYGPRIKVNPGGLVKMEVGVTGITFEILRNGLPETIIPDTEDERKRRAAEKRSKGFQDTGTYDEAVEINRRRIASEMAQYAESGSAFDPAGDYLCKTCTQMDLPKSCGVVATNKINPEDTSCRYWVNDIPLVQLQMKFSPKETDLTSRPNWKGFGCKRCVYGSEAKVPDSKGRPSWCSWFGIHVLPNACCAENEGDDDVVIK